MLRKGSQNQQIWAIYLTADLLNQDKTLMNQDKTLIDELLRKVESPCRDVRVSAISVIHRLAISDAQLDQICSKVKIGLIKRNPLIRLLTRIRGFIFGIGILGDSEIERIQMVGMLIATDKTKLLALESFASAISISNLYKYRYEWSELVLELIEKLSQDDIETILDEISKIIADKDKDNSFFRGFVYYLIQTDVDPNIKERLVEMILRLEDEAGLYVISLLRPTINQDDRCFTDIKNALANEDYHEANAAYEILDRNRLLDSAF
jgi:hypothetical protein